MKISCNKLFSCFLAAALIVSACAPEEIGGADDRSEQTDVPGSSEDSGKPDDSQQPDDPVKDEVTLNIQPESIVFDTEGGKDIAVISSSDAWTARIINARAESWCSIEPASGEAGDTEMTVTVQANETPDERSASVVVTCGDKQKTIVVTQKQKDALTVTASRFDIGAEGGSIAVEVKANIDFEYIIEETAKEWLEYETTKAMNSSTLVFTVAPNESLDKREGAIAIQSGDLKETITVYQEGEKPSIVISQNNCNVPSVGGDIAIEVSSNVDVTVQMPESASWIRENATKAMSTNTYHFLVDENTDDEKRECAILFVNNENGLSEQVTVTQDGYASIIYDSNNADEPLVYDLSLTSSPLFYVTAGSEYTVESDSEWCRAIELDVVREDIPYCIEADRNTTGETRTAYITVQNLKTGTSEVITVIQPSHDIVICEADTLRYYFDYTESTLRIPVTTNMDLSDIEISYYHNGDEWIIPATVETKAFRNDTLVFNLPQNDETLSRHALMEIRRNDYSWDDYIVSVTQRSKGETDARNALINFYEKMGGDNWLNKENWCSNEYTSTWYGVSEYSYSGVAVRFGENNNVSGEINNETIAGLGTVELTDNEITGVDLSGNEDIRSIVLKGTPISAVHIENCPSITKVSACAKDVDIENCPSLSFVGFDNAEIVQIKNCPIYHYSSCDSDDVELTSLVLNDCKELVQLLCSAPNLASVDLSGSSLSEANFDGGKLSSLKLNGCENLQKLYVSGNPIETVDFTGCSALEILDVRSCNLTSIDLSECTGLKTLYINDNIEMTELDLSGLENLEMARIGGNTASFHTWPATGVKTSNLKALKANGCKSLQYFEYCDYSRSKWGDVYEKHMPPYLETLELEGCTSLKKLNVDRTSLASLDLSDCSALEEISIDTDFGGAIDLTGCYNITKISSLDYYCEDDVAVLMSDDYDWSKLTSTYVSCPIITRNMYDASVDFSADGNVRTIQTATEGNGINIIVMGDGFNDKMIADGTYDRYMDQMVEGFFAYEPYRSFRHLFNVYAVTAVSERGYVYYNSEQTALGSYQAVDANDMVTLGLADTRAVQSYAKYAISEEQLNECVVIIGAMACGRSECIMHTPGVLNDYYGNGFSIAKCALLNGYWRPNEAQTLCALVAHEAGGHGFAKLADEYVEYSSTVPSTFFQTSKYGWLKNISSTDDLSTIKWAKFINDSRYAGEGLGAYEGALYATGVYRPTENSMMNNQNEAPYFNAPSREAIYYRIHKLAYGEDWEYDYETFVEYDAVNRTSAALSSIRRLTNTSQEIRKLTAPPTIIVRHMK